MTREEAIRHGKEQLEIFGEGCEHYEFIKMALQTLSQEPCEDYIRRKSIKQKLQEHYDFFVNAYGGFSNLSQNDKSRVDEITNCIAMVVNEPPVTPQALEQESCDDAIRRPTVVKFEGTNMACMGGDEIMKEFENNTQQNNDKVISLEHAKKQIGRWIGYIDQDMINRICMSLDALPSVTQKSETVTEFADRCRECGAKYGKYRKEAKRWKNKWLKSQKSGKWIKMPIGFKCSKCNELEDKTTKYCPNCGARMESEE